jgi:hypothetical protein
MITLTPDKFDLLKAGFSVRDTVDQGPRRSTLRQIVHPEGLAPPRKAVYGRADLYSTIGWDDACQRAMYPLLSAVVHRLAWMTS